MGFPKEMLAVAKGGGQSGGCTRNSDIQKQRALEAEDSTGFAQVVILEYLLSKRVFGNRRTIVNIRGATVVSFHRTRKKAHDSGSHLPDQQHESAR